MPHATLAAAIRRFPLLGRPRPACPALPDRIQEVVDAVDAAKQKAEHGMTDAAHALNKAALIASDAGMADLARQLCWQHIDTYRKVERPLTILEARHLLEPVLNLARLQIRAQQGTVALQLLEAMHQAITRRRDLTVDGHTLPTADLVGENHDRRQLREWVWLQLVGEGIRALALADRWTDAAEHARTHNGIGLHLMEGRQAAIIAHCVRGDLLQGRMVLTQSDPTQPWEQEVTACLQMMCTEPTDPAMARRLTTAVARFDARTPMAGYASYRARLGLTIATLASSVRPEQVAALLTRIADEAISSADGYAARDVLGFRILPASGMGEDRLSQLDRLRADSGLGIGTLPQPALPRLTHASNDATHILDTALQASARRRPTPPAPVARHGSAP